MEDENYIEFLDDTEELRELVKIFNICSWTYHERFLVSKNIFEMKELLKANNFNIKKTITMMLEIAKIFVINYNSNLNKNN